MEKYMNGHNAGTRLVGLVSVSVLFLITILASCGNAFDESIAREEADKGYLSISSGRSVTVFPEQLEFATDTTLSFTLKGMPSSGSQQILRTWRSSGNTTAYAIMVADATLTVDTGIWHFTLEAQRNGIVVLSASISQFEVKVGNNYLDFGTMQENMTSGTGIVDVTLSFPADGGVDRNTIRGYLISPNDSSQIQGTELPLNVQDSTSGQLSVCYYKADVAVGQYKLRIELPQAVDASRIDYHSWTVHVAANLTSSASKIVSSVSSLYSVVYVLGDEGAWKPGNVVQTTYGPYDALSLPGSEDVIPPDGYTFDGWLKDGQKVTKIAEGTTGNLTLTAQWAYEEPEKGADGKYEVSNHGNLLWIGQQLKSGAFKTVNLKLTADIVIPSDEWVPIDLPDGSPSTFDGQGHSITFDGTSGGLFVDFNYSTIENLVLKGNITGNSVKGALLNMAYCTVIRNVMSLVTITNTGTGATGGLVGTFGGRDRNGQVSTIENCAVYADVSSNGYAGGLVGELWNGNQYGKILNSVYMGEVTGNKAGAVVGYNDSNQSSPSTLQNIYYCVTNNSSIAVIGDTGAGGTVVTNVVSKTENEIKSEALSILGSSWESGSDGLPRLKKNP